jgi:glycerophosphoryl diester phosphodiesterase
MLGLLLIASLATSDRDFAPPHLTIVAHRGLAEGLPENTLAAFRHSLASGIRVIELDLRVTRDGHLVVLHDATLDRTTDCSGPVAAMSLANVKSCDAGLPTHRGERVPTLADVLDLLRDSPARLLLDCKAAPIDTVLREVRAHHAEAKVILGLRSLKEVSRARRELPGATILAFMPEHTDGPAFARAGADIIRLWSDWADADPGLVARSRALGPRLWIMVGRHLPSKPADWRALHARMIAAGAQGLITNRPDLVVP